ncbi:MAG TPA: hypothetical protein VHJ20_02565 [Polyangia bacterium]|nr:hypothetical protein [Polyangia bacterium]
MTLRSLRGSALALVAACAAWAGCATTQAPLVDPAFASGQYTPARIAVLPPDVFVVLDEAGDNDDAASAALGQAVSNETVAAVERGLRARGYDVDLSSRWDGIVAQDGTMLVSRDELGYLANGVLQFSNARDGAQRGAPPPPAGPVYVSPEMASKIGWATQSDAALYINVKGVSTTSGKRAESIVAAVFIVVVIAAIILLIVASSKGGHGGGGPGNVSGLGGGGGGVPHPGTGAWRGTPATSGWRGTPVAPSRLASGGGWHGAPAGGGVAGGGGGWRGGNAVARPAGAPVYGGGYGGGPHVGIGVGVVIPLDGPTYTHDGNVSHEDDLFAGDDLSVSMTLVSTYDGRVLWHDRQELDLDAQKPVDVDHMVDSFLAGVPAHGAPPAKKN